MKTKYPVLRPTGASKRPVRPYQQGQLDGLCGAYCLVNVVHYMFGPTCSDTATKVFSELMQYFENHSTALNRMFEGTARREILRALKDHLSYRYPMEFKSASKTNRISITELWSDMSEFMSEKDGIILLGTDEHWTLVSGVTDKTLVLFDSNNMKRLIKSRCTTSNRYRKSKTLIYPSSTYYIWTN